MYVGINEGANVGCKEVGKSEGYAVGFNEVLEVGWRVGVPEGCTDVNDDGLLDGKCVGANDTVGKAVGSYVG